MLYNVVFLSINVFGSYYICSKSTTLMNHYKNNDIEQIYNISYIMLTTTIFYSIHLIHTLPPKRY